MPSILPFFATRSSISLISYVTSGLVLFLDAGNSASYPGSGTTWTDLSENGITGTLTNGPTFSSSDGGSIVFDGSNDVVTGTSSLIDRNNGEPITVSSWIRPSRTSGQYGILVTSRSNDGGTYNWILYQHTTGGEISFHGINQNRSTYVPTINQWINVVNTVTAAGVSTLYVNGAPVYTLNGYTYGNGKPGRLGIGANPGANEAYQGNISQVSVYNRALSSAEIIQNYNAFASRYSLTLISTVIYKSSLTVGFHSGGFQTRTTTYKVTYGTETTAAAASGANLTVGKYGHAGAGNSEKGFFVAGATTVDIATTDRTTFSTETTAAVSGANASAARRLLGGAGNSTKGFFVGGNFTFTTADRTTYSTEVTAAVTGANLTQGRYGPSGVSNEDKAFFAGGYNGAYVATANKTTFSTETTVAVTGANLSAVKYAPFGIGSFEKGFYCSGENGSTPYPTTTDRVTFSTETTAAVTGGNLNSGRCAGAGTGDSNKGFCIGGFNNSPSDVATAERFTYGTETSALVSGANYPVAINSNAGI